MQQLLVAVLKLKLDVTLCGFRVVDVTVVDGQLCGFSRCCSSC